MTLSITSLTTEQKKRRDRKMKPGPCQLDMFAPVVTPPAPAAQSPRAAAIAAETMMRSEAEQVLAKKAGKVVRKTKKPAPKPKTRRGKP